MEKVGRFWPQDEDREPRTSNFHVPCSALTTADADYVPGSVMVSVTETPERVQDRLGEQFPLYRVAQAAGRLIGRGESNEV